MAKNSSDKGPSAKDKAAAMRSASRNPDGAMAKGPAQRIQAAHDRKQAKGK